MSLVIEQLVPDPEPFRRSIALLAVTVLLMAYLVAIDTMKEGGGVMFSLLLMLVGGVVVIGYLVTREGKR